MSDALSVWKAVGAFRNYSFAGTQEWTTKNSTIQSLSQ